MNLVRTTSPIKPLSGSSLPFQGRSWRPRVKVLLGFVPGILPTLGLLLMAGCACAPLEQAVRPGKAKDEMTALHFNDAAVPAAPLREMIEEIRQFFASKQGKELLLGAGGLIFACLALFIVFVILRGSPTARSKARIQDEAPHPQGMASQN